MLQPAGAVAAARAYGVTFDLDVSDAALLPALWERLPPGARARRRRSDPSFTCSVARIDDGAVRIWNVALGRESQVRTPREAEALEAFEGLVRFEVARRATRWTFVHAGVVGWRGRAIVIPGSSFSGKSRLVRALVGAGATYYSDEYAVLDQHGLVYPFAQPLMHRTPSGDRQRLTASDLGTAAGTRPLPVATIVATSYVAGATWAPRRLSPGEGLLALLQNTVQAQTAPARVMRVLARVAESACAIASVRGEAQDTAAGLLNSSGFGSEDIA